MGDGEGLKERERVSLIKTLYTCIKFSTLFSNRLRKEKTNRRCQAEDP